VLLVVLTWAPLLLLAAWTWRRTGRPEPGFADWAVQIRLLVSLPLLLLADPWLGLFTARCTHSFVDGAWAPDRAGEVRALIDRATRRLEAALPEIVLWALALTGSQLVSGGLVEGLSMRRGHVQAGWSPFTVWYRLVSLPVYQFMVYRALWRWSIWARLLWGLSRLPLRPLAAHPDRHGGLHFLAEPSAAFALVLLALQSTQAAAWLERLTQTRASLVSLSAPVAVTLLISAALALGPLLPFVPALWRGRLEGVKEYNRLARDYARMFRERWIEGDQREGLLGTATGDISGQTDLGTTVEVVHSMSLVPFGRRALLAVLAATVVPIVPLALREVPLIELVQKVGGAALGL